MAKYRKEKSVARVRKKKVFETKAIQSNEQLGYVDALSRVAIQTKLQEALEAERDEIVGRAWHAHHRGDGPRDYRNGYGDPRSLTCGCGTVEIQMPRTRQGYASGMVGKYERLTPAMKNLLPELYLHGLATGDFEPAFGWLWGEDAPLSTSTIVRLKQQWEKEYDQWKDRPLEKEYLYLWADGIYPKGGPIDETLAGSVEPPGAHDEVSTGTDVGYPTLALELGLAIVREWPRLIGLRVRFALVTVENVIGAHVDHKSTDFARRSRNPLRPFRVDGHCACGIPLGAIHVS